MERDGSDAKAECSPCRIAAGIGIAEDLCEQFKGELDCQELADMLEHPEGHSLDDAQKAIEKIAKGSEGKARELLDYTVCIMKGECPLPPDAQS